MDQPTQDLKAELQRTGELLRTLRDEVRVKMHLATMDAKAAWNKLEPQITAAERAAEHASEASVKALKDVVKAVKDFTVSLGK